jgi:hypothetical protein
MTKHSVETMLKSFSIQKKVTITNNENNIVKIQPSNEKWDFS